MNINIKKMLAMSLIYYAVMIHYATSTLGGWIG